jgi:hypothetical protein
MKNFEYLDCGRGAAEGGYMTFWLTTEALTKLDPQGTDWAGRGDFGDVSVSVRVPCGVGGVIARMSFSRL